MESTFHHIGVACQDLEKETERFATLGYSKEAADFIDARQGVKGRFLVGGGPRMELLTPLADKGVLTPWMDSGVKLYHLAYEASDSEAECSRLRKDGGKIVVPAVPAVAFNGRPISFVMLPNMLLVEIIQAEN